MRLVNYSTWEKLMENKATKLSSLPRDEMFTKLLEYSRKFKIRGAQEAKEELEREYNITHGERNQE